MKTWLSWQEVTSPSLTVALQVISWFPALVQDFQLLAWSWSSMLPPVEEKRKNTQLFSNHGNQMEISLYFILLLF